MKLVDSPDPHIHMLFAAYLADGAIDFPTVWDAIRAFREENTPAFVAAALAELRGLLATASGEEELMALSDRLPSDYHPPGDGYTYTEFFRLLEDALS